MAKKTQSTQMKAAYGQRFSQQDLTVPAENQVPVPAVTATSKTGDVRLLATLARGLRLSFTKKDNKSF